MHVGPEKVLEPSLDALSIFQYFFGDVVHIDVDTDRADDSKVPALNRNGSAFEFAPANVEFVIQFVFVSELALFQINQEAGRAIAQMPAGHIVLERDQRMSRIREIVQKNFDSGVWK